MHQNQRKSKWKLQNVSSLKLIVIPQDYVAGLNHQHELTAHRSRRQEWATTVPNTASLANIKRSQQQFYRRQHFPNDDIMNYSKSPMQFKHQRSSSLTTSNSPACKILHLNHHQRPSPISTPSNNIILHHQQRHPVIFEMSNINSK